MCAALVLIVWLTFGRATGHEFVNFDDEVYVYANPLVSRGLTLDGVVSAFTQAHARNWHPLTTISHMLDCEWFGLRPAGHHFVNILLHSLGAATLFLALTKLTGALWRSAFAAALFAVHPLRVESVAWIAERKDVLSGLFFMLTLYAYARYVEAGGRAARYGILLILFAAGLMSKPMLVTLPAVLLALDFWPLRRTQEVVNHVPRSTDGKTAKAIAIPASWRFLVLEKIPLILLATLSCVATLVAQAGTVGQVDSLPLAWRLENAAVACAGYLGQFIWPARLAPFYPHPGGTLSVAAVAASLSILVVISGTAILFRKERPWLLCGWIWYLVMLLPVIGIVQAGMQGHADRYTYLPQIGLGIAFTWTAAEAARRWQVPRSLLAVGAVTLLTALGWRAWVQSAYWRDSWTLWTHTAEVSPENEVAENNLGLLLAHDRRVDEAIPHFQKAIAIQTARGQTRYNLTLALCENNLGNAFAVKADSDAAILHYRNAVHWRPDYADGWFNLGIVFAENRQTNEAISCFEQALKVRPNDAAAEAHLGDALRVSGSDLAARTHYEKAVELEPQALWALDSLAWCLAVSPDSAVRSPDRALELAERARKLPGGEAPQILRVVAAAQAARGDFPAARAAADQGLQKALAVGDAESARKLRGDLALYRENVPVRELHPPPTQ